MFNVFVNFGDIKGEATEQGHKDWIGALSVSFQVSKTPVKARSAGGAKATEGSALAITKQVDTASPKLFEACTKGTHIPEVTIEYMRADKSGKPIVYMQIKLKEVVISGITHNPTPPGANGAPTETLNLVYSSMEQTPVAATPGNLATKVSLVKAKGTAS
jgi:type VI secretion system secreted protein Hcp